MGRYSKPQPSLMPDIDSTLCQIIQWKHIITTDLMSAFYQIPLPLHSVGSGCMPVQRWAYLAQKLPWRNSCVVYLETLFTKELLPRSPTIYTAEPTHQKSYCRTGNELPFPQAAPSPSPAPMINCVSSLMVLSKLQELVLPCMSPITISYS